MATLFSQRSRKLITQIINEKWAYKTVVDNITKKYNTFVRITLNYTPNDYKIYDVIYKIIRYLIHIRNLKNMQYRNDTDFFKHYNSVRILKILNVVAP
jgi:hypothetical protein